MATNFPSKPDDSTTLFTAADLANDNLDTKPHSTVHGNAHDAIVAVENELFRTVAPLRLSPRLPTQPYSATTNTNRVHSSSNVWTDRDGSSVDREFICYRDTSESLRLAMRTLPNGAWSEYDLQNDTDADTEFGLPMATDDEHYTVAVAVDSSGYVHLVGLNHGDALNYVISENARDIDGPFNAPAMLASPGTDEDWVTYPQFFRRPSDGKLCFVYRNKIGSGSQPHEANHFINKLDTPSGTNPTWTRIGKFFDGDADATKRCCYLSLYWDGTYILAAWALRAEGDSYNYNLYCARSADGDAWYYWSGSAWTLGKTLSSAQSFDRNETNARIFTSVAADQLEQPTVCLDSNGYPHILMRMKTGGSQQYRHVYHTGGAWQSAYLSRFAELGGPRPPLLPTGDGKVYALMSGGAFSRRVGLVDMTPGSEDYGDRFIPFADYDTNDCEFPIDWNRLRLRGEFGMTFFPQSTDTSSVRYHADNWKFQQVRTLSVEQKRLHYVVRRATPMLRMDVVGQVNVPPGLLVEQTAVDTLALVQPYAVAMDLEPYGSWYARLECWGSTESGSTTMDVVASTRHPVYSSWEDIARLQYTNTTVAQKQTPWVNLWTLSGVALANGWITIRAFLSTGTGTGTITTATLKIARLANDYMEGR